MRELYAKDLVPLARVTALERDAVRLTVRAGATRRLHGLGQGQDQRDRTADPPDRQRYAHRSRQGSLEVRGKWSEQSEKRISAEDQLKRIDMRAPQDGVVHQLTVHTIGGLVTPNEPAMLVVPSADQLAVEVKIQPHDIDNVRLEQPALLRFSSFNQRTTPQIEGVVTRVSADVSTDAKTGASYYTARISVPEEQRERLNGARLVPGMPVEAFLQIGERSVISYLTKPLSIRCSRHGVKGNTTSSKMTASRD